MREILFRGKNQGDWVYGSLVYSKNEDQYYIVEHDGDELSFEVEEETVGMFTGLFDKNGNKIFEGDIIKCNDGKTLQEVVYHNLPTNETKIDYNACFGCKTRVELPNGETGYDHYCISFNDEVIGNIHDNPELREKL